MGTWSSRRHVLDILDLSRHSLHIRSTLDRRNSDSSRLSTRRSPMRRPGKRRRPHISSLLPLHRLHRLKRSLSRIQILPAQDPTRRYHQYPSTQQTRLTRRLKDIVSIGLAEDDRLFDGADDVVFIVEGCFGNDALSGRRCFWWTVDLVLFVCAVAGLQHRHNNTNERRRSNLYYLPLPVGDLCLPHNTIT